MPNYLGNLTPYIFGTLSVLVFIACLLKILIFSLKKKSKEPSIITYRSKNHFITPTEMFAFQVIRELLPPELHVCAKPRIADVLEVENGNWQTGFKRISQKHIDFLIIETSTGRPCFAIEIDDRSHLAPHRRARDEFVDRSFTQADIPIIRFWADQPIALEDIRKHFPVKST